MNPDMVAAFALAEIARTESMLELLRTQKQPPCDGVRARLAQLAYQCALMAEPITDEEVQHGSVGGQVG